MTTNPSVALKFEQQGRGMPVVLLHGFPFDHTIWRAQIDALSVDYRVIAPDLRGHGASPAPEGVYHMADLAQDVVALLDDLGIDRAVWVGHSMGGYITMAALREAPSRVAGVVLVATHPLPDSPDKRLQREQSAQVAEQTGPSSTAHSMLAVLLAAGSEGGDPLAQRLFEVMARTSGTGMAGALRGMAARPDSTATLAAIKVPALVLAGEKDQIVSLEVASDFARQIPRARLVMIPGAGHMPMLEQPDQVSRALRDFLAEIVSG